MGRRSKIFIVIKRYLANCNLHGIRYLVKDGLHWTERLFWLITCASCWFGCIIMVRVSLDGFYNRPIAFTAESTYLDWETKFPSISICVRPQPESMNIAGSIYKKKYGTAIKPPHIWSWLFTNSLTKGNPMTISQLSKITSADVVELYKESALNCTSLMGDCIWHSVLRFNCCDEFVPLKTAAGLCYVFNSIHTKTDISLDKFIMNKNTGAGYLSIGFTDLIYHGVQTGVTVYINNNVAIPSTTGSNVKEIGTTKHKVNAVYFTLKDIFNAPDLRQVPPARRRCRFPDETENFYIYRWYSNNGCQIQLQIENMLKICGCVSHLFPYQIGMPVCNYTRVMCLNENEDAIMAKKDSRIRCLPDCEGTIIRHYKISKTGEVSDASVFKISQGIHFELLTLPTTRYRRYVVRSLLDLVVAVGSTAGLFMGAGILSLVEIPFWLLWRHE